MLAFDVFYQCSVHRDILQVFWTQYAPMIVLEWMYITKSSIKHVCLFSLANDQFLMHAQ
jgi:hypothetical protein